MTQAPIVELVATAFTTPVTLIQRACPSASRRHPPIVCASKMIRRTGLFRMLNLPRQLASSSPPSRHTPRCSDLTVASADRPLITLLRAPSLLARSIGLLSLSENDRGITALRG